MASIQLPERVLEQLYGQEYYMFARLKGSAAHTIRIYNTSELSGQENVITLSTSYRMVYTKSRMFKKTSTFSNLARAALALNLYAKLDTGTVDVSTDYFFIATRPLMHLSSLAGYKAFCYRGKTAFIIDESNNNIFDTALTVIGDVLEFDPYKLNMVAAYSATDGSVNPVLTYTVTFSAIYLTPRWALL